MSRDRRPVLVSMARTPIGRYTGALKGKTPIELGATAISAAMDTVEGTDPDHIYLGNVLQGGNGQNPARQAATAAGIPLTVPATTLNDVCLASMSATGIAASLIRHEEIDTAVVGGFDSMSRALHGLQVRQASTLGDGHATDLLIHDGLWCAIEDEGMGPISDRANAALTISRHDQDEFASASHTRAAAATTAGRLKQEITPVDALDTDEGIRPDTSATRLATLKSAFTPNGTITAGNSSQMSDAGAAGTVMAAETAARRELFPLVEVVGSAATAGPDTSLHLKPADAARRVLDRAGLGIADVGLWEINEAFAGVVLASARNLDLDMERVNVNGGAIAVGHPLGASGFRLIQTLALDMNQRGVEFGVATMCGGGGQGAAVLLKLEEGSTQDA